MVDAQPLTGAPMTTPVVFRYARGRLVRNLVGLLPLVGFPLVLHELGQTDPVLIGLFGVASAALVVAVLGSAARFKLTLEDTRLVVRGRIRRRVVPYADVTRARVRRGRGKPSRFMGPPPFRELVLEADGKRLVISSLPLGEDAFEAVVSALGDRLPPESLPAE